jgi:hypothetical protein
MSLTTRMRTSWELLQTSLRVLRDQPRLFLFPVISGACVLALALVFLAPILALFLNAGWASRDWAGAGQRFNSVFYAYGVVIYLVSMFVGTFFNVAFYNEIIRAFAGETVSLGGGFRFALSRLRAILMWSLLAATVGLIIRAIEERLGWLGRIVMGLLGTVWSVAAVFAIPVIIRRTDSNPLAVLRDSAATLKRTWGESLIGFVGIRLGGAAFVFASLVFGMIAVIGMAAFKQPWVLFLAVVVWLIAVLAASFLVGIATHVYRCALYVYASEGVVPGPFTAEMMNRGWKVKKV